MEGGFVDIAAERFDARVRTSWRISDRLPGIDGALALLDGAAVGTMCT
jgi:hypothetical protein